MIFYGLCFVFVLLAAAPILYFSSPETFYTITGRFQRPQAAPPTLALTPSKMNVRINNASNVSMQTYLQLKDGMTYETVKQLIGSDGTLTGSTKVKGETVKFYQWQNPSGSNLGAQFRANKLTLKTRFYLETL